MADQTPAVGMPGNPARITDPRALRALAHPARLKILTFLATEGPATATQCAAVAGLSPSACSYHLRALAQYGFVEEDLASAGDGRQRPWRCRVISMQWDPADPAAAGLQLAGEMLEETLRSENDELRRSYQDRQSQYPLPWQQVAGCQIDVLHVTPEELQELQHGLVGFFADYRRLSRDERPAGARRVAVLADFTPWFEPESP
jgi:DNA-binding transcriptional ArsR family regulator